MSTTQRPSIRILRGLSSLGLLAALGVAAPIALWRTVGWPLPRSIPGSSAWGQPIADDVFINAVAVLCWLAWAQLMVCLAAEVVACLRGRATPRLPVSGASQRLAGWLVASFLALQIQSPATASVTRLPISASRPTASVVPTAAVHVEPAPLLTPEHLHEAAIASSGESPECVVGPRDNLWAIAERQLGNPRRWPEIFELNRARPQADGDSLTNPRRINPGWTLRLPLGAPTARSSLDASAVVVPGDSLSSLARRHLGDARRWPEVFRLNEGQPQPDGRSLRDPDLIRPRWVLRFQVDPPTPGVAPALEPANPVTASPPAPESVPASPEPPPGQQVPTASEPAPTPAAPEEQTAADDTGTTPAPALAVLGTGLTAVGIVVALDRLRRARARHRLPGRPPAPPDPDLGGPELVLRSEACEHQADVDRLDIALRALGGALAQEADRPRPQIVAVQVAADSVEFLLGECSPSAPDGFAATDAGWTWTISTEDIDAVRPSTDRVAPLPALVTLGTGVGGTVLFDLETAGAVAITGEPGEVRRLLHLFVLELATSTWADHLDVLVVGDGLTGIETLPRVRQVASLMDVFGDLETAASNLRGALADNSSTFAARTTGDGGDGWIPTVLICTEPPDSEAADRLARVVGDGGSGVGVVVAGPLPSARWTLHCNGETIETTPLGLRLSMTGLTGEDLDAADELLTKASEPVDMKESAVDFDVDLTAAEAPAPDRVVALPAVLPIEELNDEPLHEAPFDVEVRLLGPVEVVGGGQPVEGGRPLELLAYLALHPAGVDGDRLRAALWRPDRPPAAKTFANTISITRGFIGARHFPPATTEVYRLAGTVTTDVSRFEALAGHATGQARASAIETLRSALSLVRGHPFTAAQGFHWVQPEGHLAHVGALVVDTAHRMVELCLAAGDATGAAWAARQGLLASPGNEILYRHRMVAADAAGNAAGVHAAMAELCDLLETDDLTDRVHPDTLLLYEQLTSKWAKRATG